MHQNRAFNERLLDKIGCRVKDCFFEAIQFHVENVIYPFLKHAISMLNTFHILQAKLDYYMRVVASWSFLRRSLTLLNILDFNITITEFFIYFWDFFIIYCHCILRCDFEQNFKDPIFLLQNKNCCVDYNDFSEVLRYFCWSQRELLDLHRTHSEVNQ